MFPEITLEKKILPNITYVGLTEITVHKSKMSQEEKKGTNAAYESLFLEM